MQSYIWIVKIPGIAVYVNSAERAKNLAMFLVDQHKQIPQITMEAY